MSLFEKCYYRREAMTERNNYLTISEAASELNESEAFVITLCQQRKLPAFSIDEEFIITRAALEAFIAAKARRETGEEQATFGVAIRHFASDQEIEDYLLGEERSFKERSGVSPADYVDSWNRGEIEDTSKNMSLAIEAHSLDSALRRLAGSQ